MTCVDLTIDWRVAAKTRSIVSSSPHSLFPLPPHPPPDVPSLPPVLPLQRHRLRHRSCLSDQKIACPALCLASSCGIHKSRCMEVRSPSPSRKKKPMFSFLARPMESLFLSLTYISPPSSSSYSPPLPSPPPPVRHALRRFATSALGTKHHDVLGTGYAGD